MKTSIFLIVFFSKSIFIRTFPVALYPSIIKDHKWTGSLSEVKSSIKIYNAIYKLILFDFTYVVYDLYNLMAKLKQLLDSL